MWSSVAALEAYAIVSVYVKSPWGLPTIMFMSRRPLSITSTSSSTRSTPLWNLSKLDIVIDHEFVSYLTRQFTIRIRQSYKILSLSRAVFCYQPYRQRDERVNQWTQAGAACGRFSISAGAMPGVALFWNAFRSWKITTQLCDLQRSIQFYIPFWGQTPKLKPHNSLIFNKLNEKASPAFRTLSLNTSFLCHSTNPSLG